MTEAPVVPGQMALPGLSDLPTFHGFQMEPVHVRREMVMADNRRRRDEVKKLRQALLDWDRTSDRRFPSQVILIRITVGRNGVGALVDFRDHRVGMSGLRHRLGGALPLDPSDVLGHGPTGGLRRALKALLEVTE